MASERAEPTLEDVDKAFSQLRASHLTEHICTCEPPCVLETYNPEEPPVPH